LIEILRTTKQFEIFRKIYDEKSVGFVPTMGNLHKGHLSLAKESLRNNDLTIVSIFVNPKQFCPGEDYEKYPRTLGEDTAQLKELFRSENLMNSDKRLAIFAPESILEIYSPGFSTVISLPMLSNKLCGLNRPGHFDGVSTVVFSLFSIVRPHKAYFGQKDYQQYLIIKKMMVAIDGLERPVYTGERRVLLFTPAGDHHDIPGGECQELPLLFMQYMLKKEGVPAIYMGKNVPLTMLQQICAQHACTQLYFLIIPNLNKCDMHEYIKKLAGMFPDKEIVFSGPEACQCSSGLPNVRLLKTIDEKKVFLKEGVNREWSMATQE
jgi:cytidyltransferase-like protein